jgi:hypothetical protein
VQGTQTARQHDALRLCLSPPAEAAKNSTLAYASQRSQGTSTTLPCGGRQQPIPCSRTPARCRAAVPVSHKAPPALRQVPTSEETSNRDRNCVESKSAKDDDKGEVDAKWVRTHCLTVDGEAGHADGVLSKDALGGTGAIVERDGLSDVDKGRGCGRIKRRCVWWTLKAAARVCEEEVGRPCVEDDIEGLRATRQGKAISGGDHNKRSERRTEFRPGWTQSSWSRCSGL